MRWQTAPRMLSVIIATKDSERALVPTLSALVSGATAGIISEVLIADGGSGDDTAAVAEVAGCNFTVMDGTTAQRLKSAAGEARAPWLLFLRPGTILDAPWTGDARRFVELIARQDCAAVFRRGAPMQSGLRDALSLLATALGARPRPEQGLLIAKEFYAALGGHSETAADAETDLIRRIGRRRIVRLPSIAYSAL
jgi:glycosyltransferase involved in cell wall biosynthesis